MTAIIPLLQKKPNMQPFHASLEITQCTQNLDQLWDDYVQKHPNSSYCHLSAWKKIFGETYGHSNHYLLAHDGKEVFGVLPMFYIRNLTGRGGLISMPFLDTGGIIAHSPEIESQLLLRALSLAKGLKVDGLELRYNDMPQWACTINQTDNRCPESFYDRSHEFYYSIHTIKVRMLLTLPSDPEILMSSFKSKLRSQIKRSMKEGCEPIVGGRELVNQFYNVFAANMRDLGSPVHSKRLFEKIFDFFPDGSRIFLIRKGETPIAGSLTIGFKDMLSNPWASSLKKYSTVSPNMLLYWKMLEYACQQGFSYFDFGRSSPNKGTFKFKEQWGAEPHALNWMFVSSSNDRQVSMGYDRSKYERAIAYWKRLPVPVTKFIGPKLRKHITL